jgi:AraC family transcriptional regulator of adaptative response / DNA-3-methyladenine glycosylase II
VAGARFEEIAALGITPARSNAIIDIARAIVEGKLRLDYGADIEQTLARLRALRGIGEWTAQYIAMRALGWPDAFPHTDLGIIKALGENKPKRILEMAEAWRPWRSYATMHIWRSLEAKK